VNAWRILAKFAVLLSIRLSVFTVRSLAGPKKMIHGKLQPSSLDVYIAMELGSDGDLFNLRCNVF